MGTTSMAGFARPEIYGHTGIHAIDAPYAFTTYGGVQHRADTQPAFDSHPAELHEANLQAAHLNPYLAGSVGTRGYAGRYGYSPHGSAAPLSERKIGMFDMETQYGLHSYTPYGG